VAELAAAVLLAVPVAALAMGRGPTARPPGSGAVYEYLKGIAIAPSGRTWAVGAVWPTAKASASVIERWNGRSWRLVAGPDLGSSVSSSNLASVAMAPRRGAWAVGSVTFGGITTETLIERWNRGSWRRVPSPSPGGSPGVSSLAAVATLSRSDAWAVGYYTHVDLLQGAVDRTLIEHWAGGAWKRIRSPSPGGQFGSYLLGVAAVSPGDAWAVGHYLNGRDHDQTLIERWNGRAWRRVPSPSPGGPGESNLLYGVAAISPSKAWAVGAYATPSGTRTLIERWNGRAWRQVRSPSPGGRAGSFLYAVAVTSKSRAWAVGTYLSGGSDRTLIERWNGTSWSKVASPDPGGPVRRSFLSAVAARSASSAWAAGFFDAAGGTERTLVERWNGAAWRHVTTPSL